MTTPTPHKPRLSFCTSGFLPQQRCSSQNLNICFGPQKSDLCFVLFAHRNFRKGKTLCAHTAPTHCIASALRGLVVTETYTLSQRKASSRQLVPADRSKVSRRPPRPKWSVPSVFHDSTLIFAIWKHVKILSKLWWT